MTERTAFEVLSDVVDHPADVIAYLREHGGFEIVAPKPTPKINPADPLETWPINYMPSPS
jgi:hypothetical protein